MKINTWRLGGKVGLRVGLSIFFCLLVLFQASRVYAQYDPRVLRTPFYDPNASSCGTGGSSGGGGTMDVGAIGQKYTLQSAIVKQIGGSVVGSFNADQSPPTVASVLKLIIADAFLSLKPDLNKTVTVTVAESYFGASGGDGSLASPKVGQTIKLGDALEQTLKFSSDTDANVLIDAVGGLNSATAAATTLGYANTAILSYYNDAGIPTIAPNQTTVTDLTAAMEKIYTSTDPSYMLAHKYLNEETVKYGLASDANKWGGTSKVSGNSAVFIVGDKQYIITMYIVTDWQGDKDGSITNSGPSIIKNATNEIVGQLTGGSGSYSGGCCSGTLLSGSTNEEKVWNYFVGTLGFTAIQAAGAMGNIKAESGFNPLAMYPSTTSPTPPADNSKAWGLAQWIGGRQDNLVNFASDQGKDPAQLDVQLDFLKKELEDDVRPGVLDDMKKATTIEDATRIWLERFESPCVAGSGCDAEMIERLSNAQDILSRLGSGSGATNTGSSCSGSSDQITGGYALPVDKHFYDENPVWFTKPHHDYPAADIPVPEGTSVYAVRGGTVRLTTDDCGTGLTIDGDDGFVYNYCHGSDGGSVPGAQPGDTVITGQLIMHSDHTGHVIPEGISGTHLHFGIYVNGNHVCPQNFLVDVATGVTPNVATLPSSGCTN